MRLALFAVVALLLMGAAGGIGYELGVNGLQQPAATFAVQGTITAPACQPYGLAGADVKVLNEMNTVVAVSSTSNKSYEQSDCLVYFTVYVPREKFYQFRVGGHEGLTYSFNQMAHMGWQVNIDFN